MSAAHERLQQARAKAGFPSGSAAAEAFGWAVSTYLGHENGSRRMRPDVAKRYARAFGVSWTWLLGGEGEDKGFGDITQMMTGIPVAGVLDAGAFRAPGSTIDGYPRELHIQIVGYRAEELRAYIVYGSDDLHFAIATQTSSGLLEGDVLIIRRSEVLQDRTRVELAAWRIDWTDGEMILRPVYTPEPTVPPMGKAMLDEPGVVILGVVVAEFRIKRRARVIRGEPLSDGSAAPQ